MMPITEDTAMDASSDKLEARDRSRSPIRFPSEKEKKELGSYGRKFQESDPKWAKRLVFVNVPYETDWMELKNICKDRMSDPPYVCLMERPDGKPRGLALAEFRSGATAETAFDLLQPLEIRGRTVVLRRVKETEKRMVDDFINLKRGGGDHIKPMPDVMSKPVNMMPKPVNMMPVNTNATCGISPELLHNLGLADTPITNSVFVSNLDFKVTDSKVRDIFSLAGSVQKVEMKNDSDGKFRGMCVVHFDFPLESVQAISMFDGQQLFDRAMKVKMDRIGSISKDDKSEKLPTGLKSIGMGLGQSGSILNVRNQIGGDMMTAFSPKPIPASMNVPKDVYPMNNGRFGEGSTYPMGFSSMTNDNDPNRFMSGGAMMPMNPPPQMMGNQQMMNYNVAPNGSMWGPQGMKDNMIHSRLYPTSTPVSRGVQGGNNSSESERVYGEPGTRIFVANIPFAWRWNDLKDFFMHIGKIEFVEIKMNNNKSRGFGIIRFATVDEANRAIAQMQGVKVEGRALDIRTYV